MAYALRMNISEAERIEKRPGLWFICLRITRYELIDMFARCFLMELWGRMQYAPTLPAGDISIMLAINFFPESILFLS